MDYQAPSQPCRAIQALHIANYYSKHVKRRAHNRAVASGSNSGSQYPRSTSISMDTFSSALKAIKDVAATGITAIQRQVASEDDHVAGNEASSDVSAKQGQDHPSDPATDGKSTSKPVPANIQTFRTIIHFLSQLGVKEKSEPDPKPSRAIQQELQVADAFAHVGVISHDVIALSASRVAPDNMGFTAVCPDTSPAISQDNDTQPSAQADSDPEDLASTTDSDDDPPCVAILEILDAEQEHSCQGKE